MFLPEFLADLSHYKEMRVHCTCYKKIPTLFHRHFAPLGPGCQNFNTRFQFGLHTPLKFYLDPLRFAGVICEKPIFSKCILSCRAFA